MLIQWTAATMMVMNLAAQTVYVGTRSPEGIYRMRFDPATGAISDVKIAGKTLNPTFVAVHPKRPLVFAVVAAPEGKVSSFAVEPDGGLRLLNEVSSKGQGPAHVQIDRTGQWVSTANFGSGGVAVYKIEELFVTGKAPYPVERTLIVSGMLESCLQSRKAGGKLLATPHLAVRYQGTRTAQHARG